jgi:hypothetical protein
MRCTVKMMFATVCLVVALFYAWHSAYAVNGRCAVVDQNCSGCKGVTIQGVGYYLSVGENFSAHCVDGQEYMQCTDSLQVCYSWSSIVPVYYDANCSQFHTYSYSGSFSEPMPEDDDDVCP